MYPQPITSATFHHPIMSQHRTVVQRTVVLPALVAVMIMDIVYTMLAGTSTK